MNTLTQLPNIGDALAEKLERVGIHSEADLKETGTEKTIIKLASLEDCEPCINMIYAIEGAIQGIRWHGLNPARKEELKSFYYLIKIQFKN